MNFEAMSDKAVLWELGRCCRACVSMQIWRKPTSRAKRVGMAVANWIKLAQDAQVDGALSKTMALSHRLNLMG